MKIAYKHLLNFIEGNPSLDDLSEKLFHLGHEHEILEGQILDMEFTPNRGDCLSLLGLSRDLNPFFKSNDHPKIYEKKIESFNLDFTNNSKSKCPNISFLKIEIDGNISKYSSYLEDYFSDLKINKNNLFTDVSNYIAYELGQPTHCYEMSSLKEGITLQENSYDSNFKTLLGKDINIDKSDLVFLNNNKVINLAGIMGGIETSCSETTKTALIECAYFKPDAIIGRSVKYNIHSDASHKFERGVDPSCHQMILRRFVQIISEHTKILSLEIFSQENEIIESNELPIDLEKINSILGTNLELDKYIQVLSKLGFEIGNKITIPSYRSDISHQNDLSEELARVIGYNNLPTESINLEASSVKREIRIEDKLKHFLVNNGFSEVINSPFCSSGNHPDKIKVDNPLDSNREYLRTNISDSLVKNLIFNENRQNDSIKLFEVSEIYTKKDNILRVKKFALIVSGRVGHNYLDFAKKLDQNYLDNLFKKIGINIGAEVLKIDRTKLNSKIKTPAFYVELPIEDITGKLDSYLSFIQPIDEYIKYQPVSEFPSSYRDISFSVTNKTSINKVLQEVEKIDLNCLKKVFMFDYYENSKTYETKIGYRFIFQDPLKTLRDSEIEENMEKILNGILTIDSVSIPGRN